MNKFACPDPEVLAAFVDGRLEGEERRRIVEHLDRCEDCYEVFAEVARFQGEDVSDARVLRPAASRWGLRQPRTWITAAAAAVLVAVILVPAMTTDREEVGPDSASLVQAMDVEPGVLLASRWAPPSGFGFAPTPPDRAFGIGVRLVDLHVAIGAADAVAAGAEIAGLHRALAAADLAGALEDELEAAAGAAEEGRLEEVRTAAATIEAEAEDRLDRDSLAFGKWAEAGRLAAAGRDASFFGTPTFSGFREQVEERDDPTVTEVLALLGQGPLTHEDLDEAKRLFTAIVSTYAPANGDRR